MDFEIQRLFETEALVTEDPWGLGYTFRHKTAADPDYRDWLASLPGNSVGEAIQRKMRTRVARMMLERARRNGHGDQVAVDAEALEGVRDEVLAELAESYEAETAEAVDGARGVALLLTGWEGINDADGNAVPFEPEAVYELLSNRTLVPEDQEYAGSLVGKVHCDLILETARGAVVIDSVAMDEAEKKSAAGTGGS